MTYIYSFIWNFDFTDLENYILNWQTSYVNFCYATFTLKVVFSRARSFGETGKSVTSALYLSVSAFILKAAMPKKEEEVGRKSPWRLDAERSVTLHLLLDMKTSAKR